MTDRERLQRFIAARKNAVTGGTAAQRATLRAVQQALEKAEEQIARSLGSRPTDWQRHHLPRLSREVAKALQEADEAINAAARAGHAEAVAGGRLVLVGSFEAAGIDISAILQRAKLPQSIAPQLSAHQLAATKSFCTGKMDIAVRCQKHINEQLTLVVAGAADPARVTGNISSLLSGNRARALTVTRTELNRAYGTATFEHMLAAGELFPGLKKQWRSSGKIHYRVLHAIIDGLTRELSEPFMIGGEAVMYPRAPGVSAKNSVNCGCMCLPYMATWRMSDPRVLGVD